MPPFRQRNLLPLKKFATSRVSASYNYFSAGWVLNVEWWKHNNSRLCFCCGKNVSAILVRLLLDLGKTSSQVDLLCAVTAHAKHDKAKLF